MFQWSNSKNALAAVGAVLVMVSPHSSHAHGTGDGHVSESAVATAAAEAIGTFAADYTNATGQVLKDQFLGFSANLDGESVEVAVFHFTAADQLTTSSYGCHVHADGSGHDAHCAAVATSSPRPFSLAKRHFSHANFVPSIEAALAAFEADGIAPASLAELKLWQNKTGIEVAATRAGSSERVFAMCHFHGAGIDCHTKKNAGAGEP